MRATVILAAGRLYQLYMHMAPLSDYPKRPLYRITQKGQGVRMRRHSRHDDSREIVPDVLANKHGHARTLMQGDTLAVLQQKSFLLERQPDPFALAQRLLGINAHGISGT